MSNRFFNPFPRFLTDNIAALDAGKLFFYENDGGTTLKTTYSDSDLTTPNANPVILSAGGVAPDIFLSGSYRVVLQDKNGVQLDSADNVNDATTTIEDDVNDDVTVVLQGTHTTSGTPANGIGASMALKTETSDGNIETGTEFESVTTDVTLGSEDFKWAIKLMTTGAPATRTIEGDATSIYPTNNDGQALGKVLQAFSDLFGASGFVMNFDNGDVTITHSANTLTMAGGNFHLPGLSFDGGTNTLDEFEEGTFTPVIEDTSNNAVTATISGRYQRTGSYVKFMVQASVSSLGSATGVMRVSGLPFNVADNGFGGTVNFANNLALGVASGMTVQCPEFTDNANLYVWDATGGPTGLTHTELTASGDLEIHGFYYTED